MGCNCKKALQIENKYGTKVEESFAQKSYRTFWKILALLLGMVFGIVLVPTIVVILIYNQVFRGGKGVTIPKSLSKYILRVDGKKL